MPGDKKGETSTSRLKGSLDRGATVGRYLIVGLIGRGGMGEVYAAYDPELDRKIALKLLRATTTAGVDPSEGRARLVREAQAIARLSDPNVVTVFDVGTYEDRVFLAMEFVDGNTIGHWLHAKARTWREVVAIFGAAGKGLAAAHRAGVVHRDFKPDNVMIGRDGQVRVMDFGLARTTDVDADKGDGLDGIRDTPRRLARSTGRVSAPMTARSSASVFVAQEEVSAPKSAKVAKSVAATSSANAAGAEAADAVPTTVTRSGATQNLHRLPGMILPEANPGREKNAEAWAEDDIATRDLGPAVLEAAAAIAEAKAAEPVEESPLTESGAMMGTPAYMAPEQFQGQVSDARSDQFSFCVALYEGLYGQRPFEGKNITALTTNVVGGRIREAPANARVPRWLRKVVLRGLRTSRADRYLSMEALLAQLARDPARSRRRAAAVASVMTLIAVLGLGLFRAEREQRTRCRGAEGKLAGVWELPGRGASARKDAIHAAFMASGKRYAADSFTAVAKVLDRYVTDWNTMHREACEATNVRGEQSAEVLDLRMGCLQDRFAEVRALTNVFATASGDVVTKSVEAVQSIRPVEQCADVAALKAVVRPPDEPAIRHAVADVRNRLAEVKALTSSGQYQKAAQTAGKVAAAARTTKYEPVIAESVLQVGQIQMLVGDVAQSRKNFEDAVWLGESSRHDEVVAEAAAELVYVAGYLQNHADAADLWARHADAVLRRLGPGHELVEGWLANNLGVLYEKQGRLEEALAADLRAVALKQKALGGENIDVAISEDNVALALFQLGRVGDAIDRNSRAMGIYLKTVGADHPGLAISLNNASEFLTAAGRAAEARLMAERAQVLLEREPQPNQLFLGFVLTALGRALTDEGRAAAAVPVLERALSIREEGEPEPGLAAETRFALARALWSTSRPERALVLAKQARTDFRREIRAPRARAAELDHWIAEHEGHLTMR